ncbi:hypothetical protein TIFTF001_021278 [Ficus carica]|uniref:Terpene synthase metal-binding domain-containing protein n=1 Tax=Ficus carica TaxID=3494 RepID=A0AA88AYR2_FICCA|nr:hypothetical protein TIFTF001_021278 [Ficus carica]
MHETGVSEDEARRHMFSLLSETWKHFNEDRATNSAFSRTFMELITNFTRTTMWLYDGRDGYGVQNHCVKDSALSVFVNPISLEHGDEDI